MSIDDFYKQDKLFPDRYNRNSRWNKILFRPGLPLQSAELIELQSMLQDGIKQGLNTLYYDGSILEGLEINVLNRSNENIEISIQSGKIYAEGKIISVNASTLIVPIVGEFDIGVDTNPSILTEYDDPTLRDPLKGGARYGVEGAHRLIINPTISLNSSTAYCIGKVNNGNIVTVDKSSFRKIDSRLAQTTYETKGNFCVTGLSTSSLPVEEKIVLDRAKYDNLVQSKDNAENEYNLLLNELETSDSRLSNLNSLLSEAVEKARLTPISENLIAVSQLETLIQQEENFNQNQAILLTSKQKLLNKQLENLDNSKSLLADRAILNVEPGLAYVKGFRINKNSPTKIYIPITKATQQVTSAVFNYAGRIASSLRTFTLNTLYADLVAQRTQLRIEFENLLYKENRIAATFVCNLASFNFNSLEELLDLLISELNKKSDSAPSSGILFLSSENIDGSEIRRVIKNNINVYRENANGLLFNSVSLNTIANQLKVNIFIDIKDQNDIVMGKSDKLSVDLESAYLSGAGIFNDYRLGFRPVAEIIRLVAELEADSVPVVRGSVPGTIDNLTDDSIIKITRVYQGSTEYVEGDDYRLINQSQIDWSISQQGLPDNEPAPGTTYYVSFIYTQPLAKDIDFELNQKTDSIEFIGNTPASNRSFFVDYSYYLAQAGTLYLNSEGEVKYILSEPSINPISPQVEEDVLVLATFKLFLDRVEITNKECKVIKYKEINQLIEQIRNNQDLVDGLNIENKAYSLAYEDIQENPKGLFTDSLRNLANINPEETTASISVASQGITSGYVHKDVPLDYKSGGKLNNNLYVSMPYSFTSFKSNNRLTKTRKVIPQQNFVKAGAMTLSCREMFLNENIRLLNPCDYIASKTSLLARISNNKPLLLSEINLNNQSLFSAISDTIVDSINSGVPANFSNYKENDFITFITDNPRSKSIEINISVTGLKPNSDGYEIYFSGQKISDFSLLDNTILSLTNFGTIKASDKGEVNVKFSLNSRNIKGGVRCGTHLVELKSNVNQGYASSNFYIHNNLATQIIISALRNWNIEYSTNTINNLELPYYVENEGNNNLKFSNFYSSINQVFTTNKSMYLTSVDLKLKSIDVNHPLIVKIRSMDIFKPSFDTYTIGLTNNYNPSLGGAINTRFTLVNPILITKNKKYCISLESLGSGFEIFTSELGEPDLITGGTVGNQIFNTDNLYLSFDGQSLNNNDKEDISYQLNKAVFDVDKTEIVDLGSYVKNNGFSLITSFCLNIRDIQPENTFIEYQYSLDKGQEWIAFNKNEVVCLNNTTDTLNLRALLSSSDSDVSPAIVSKGASVSLYQNKKFSYLTSKIIPFQKSFSNIVVSFEYVQLDTNVIKVYYNSGTDSNWIPLSVVPNSTSIVDESNDIYRVKWKITLNQANLINQFRYKIEINSESNIEISTIRNIISYVY